MNNWLAGEGILHIAISTVIAAPKMIRESSANCFFNLAEKMQVTINGADEEIPEATIQKLLAARGLDEATVVVEINGEILPPDKFAATSPKAGDVIELIQFVGGG